MPTFRRLLQLATLGGRGLCALHALLVLLQALVPVAGLWVMQRLIDAVARGLTAPRAEAAFADVLAAVGLAAGLALAGAVLRATAGHVGEAHGRLVTDECTGLLLEQASGLDLADLEDPEGQDLLHRAAQEGSRPARILLDLAGLLLAGLLWLAMAAVLWTVAPWLPVLVSAAALPAVWLRLRQAKAVFRWQTAAAPAQREAAYFGSLLTGRAAAKELRLFGLAAPFLAKARTLRQQLRQQALGLSAARARADVAGHALAGLALFSAYAWLGWHALGGALTIGGFVMQAQAVQRAQGAVRDLLAGIAALAEHRLFLTHLMTFLARKPSLVAPAAPKAVPKEPARLRCEALTFAYPGAKAPVLAGLDLELAPGEAVALVGRNGSGKSTLVRLLCRLHDPTQGAVRFGGIDLREFDPVQWRRQLTVLFQDALPLDLSAAENIACSDPGSAIPVEPAAEATGIAARLRALPEGFAHRLGRRFQGGAELSAGEWRRLLLARALHRRARLVVLDEPSAFLDPEAEQALFARLRSTLAGATVLVADHRPAAVQWADRICVLEGGRIVASGRHEELLARAPQYRQLLAARG